MEEPPLPKFAHYGEYQGIEFDEVIKTEKGRAWLLKQYWMLGNCSLKQAMKIYVDKLAK